MPQSKRTINRSMNSTEVQQEPASAQCSKNVTQTMRLIMVTTCSFNESAVIADIGRHAPTNNTSMDTPDITSCPEEPTSLIELTAYGIKKSMSMISKLLFHFSPNRTKINVRK